MKQAGAKLFVVLMAAALLAACSPAPVSVSSAPSQSVSVSAPSVSVSLPTAEIIPPYESPIDFYALMEQGEDICAWLTVGGTNIDYPVVRGMDNEYYLTHDAYGEWFAGGALFADMVNATDFQDPVTVIYGHVMPDDTIFSQLHLYKDADFFAANRTITLYLPDNGYTYEVFAAFPNDASNLLFEHDYTNNVQFEGLLAAIEQKAEDAPNDTNVDMDGVTAGDKLLLLSTCDNEGQSRYIVAARLIDRAA